MKQHINQNIKNREMFRPFSPAIIKEEADKFFDMPKGAESASQFMLLSIPALPEKINTIPAALHVDGTGRAQLVDKAVDPLFHKLITRFGEATGVPVLLNTSLNLQGQPIVRGEDGAVEILNRCLLDFLVVENRIYNSV